MKTDEKKGARKKILEKAKAEVERLKNEGKPSVLSNPEFQKADQKAKSDLFKPYVVDKNGKAHKVKPLGMKGEMVCVDNSKNTRSRVVDPEDNVDVNFKGSMLKQEIGTPYYSEKHGEPMRVMETGDGSIVAFPQSAIVPLSRRTKKSYALGASVSQKRFDDIFKSRRKVKE